MVFLSAVLQFHTYAVGKKKQHLEYNFMAKPFSVFSKCGNIGHNITFVTLLFSIVCAITFFILFFRSTSHIRILFFENELYFFNDII